MKQKQQESVSLWKLDMNLLPGSHSEGTTSPTSPTFFLHKKTNWERGKSFHWFTRLSHTRKIIQRTFFWWHHHLLRFLLFKSTFEKEKRKRSLVLCHSIHCNRSIVSFDSCLLLHLCLPLSWVSSTLSFSRHLTWLLLHWAFSLSLVSSFVIYLLFSLVFYTWLLAKDRKRQ